MFTFNENRQKVFVPTTVTPVAFKDKNGNDLSGDDLLRMFGKVVEKHDKTNKVVPIPNQDFVSWIRWANEELSAGKTSRDIFAASISRV